jgi:predicted permease
LIGGFLGLALAVAGIRGLVSVLPDWLPRTGDIGLDGRVLLFTLVLTVLVGLSFGLAPALHGTRGNLSEALKQSAGGNVGPQANRLRKALVIGQTSLAMTLLVSSILLVRGFFGLETTEFGWSDKNLLTFQVSLPEKDYESPHMVDNFYSTLLSRLTSLPGVESVGGTSLLPRLGHTTTLYSPVGEAAPDVSQQPSTGVRRVLPGYFKTMEIALAQGRVFAESDRNDALPVVVINEMLRERHWKDEDPVGDQIDLFDEAQMIVGVVHNTLDFDLEKRPMAYLPAFQAPSRRMSVVLRTPEEPYSLVKNVRAEIERMDSDLPIYAVTSMSDLMKQDMVGYSMAAKVMTVLAAVALVLTLVGVYGTMIHYVAQRTQEIGIRMAIGAKRGHVLCMVLQQGVTLSLIGVGAGVCISLAVTRSLSVFLFGVNPFDPATFTAVSTSLLLAGLVATYSPALRATRVDPRMRHSNLSLVLRSSLPPFDIPGRHRALFGSFPLPEACCRPFRTPSRGSRKHPGSKDERA